MRSTRFPPPAGFTLVEALIVLAIVAILLGIGMPTFNESMRDRRLSTMTSEFISAVYVARNEALTRRTDIKLAPLVKGWQTGWIIMDGTTVLHRYMEPSAAPDLAGDMRVAIRSTANAAMPVGNFVFTPKGQVRYGPGAIGGVNVLICDDRPAERGRTLMVSAIGTVQNTPHLTPNACQSI